jgi:hypothetical protein
MMRRLIATALAAGALLVGSALPASASTLSGETPLTRAHEGTNIGVVRCPPDEQFVSGSADFYRKQGGKVLATVEAVEAPDDPGLITFLVPKGARYVVWTATCEPIPPPVIQLSISETTSSDGTVFLFCPADHGYLAAWPVVNVTFDTGVTAILDDPGVDYTKQAETLTGDVVGISFYLPAGTTYSTVLSCSDQPTLTA